METTAMLDRLAAAVERVLKGATAATREMTTEEFTAYALDQVEKAANDEPARAVRRLRALGQAVDAAKQAFVDHESERIKVEVYEEERTAAADETEREISPLAAATGLGASGFAGNAEDLGKALARLQKELPGLKEAAPREQPAPADSRVTKGDDAVWPEDMNTRAFRGGVRKAEDEPTWGYDTGRGEPVK